MDVEEKNSFNSFHTPLQTMLNNVYYCSEVMKAILCGGPIKSMVDGKYNAKSQVLWYV